MFNSKRIGIFVGIVFLCAFAACANAAMSASPNISGDWTGSASGNTFREDTSNVGGTSTAARAAGSGFNAIIEKASASVSASLVQVGNDLVIDARLQTKDNQTIDFHLIGKAGDFALWAAGTHTPVGETLEQVFLSGQFDSKAKKIVGSLIVYKEKDITSVGYSLKKVTAKANSRAEASAKAQAGPQAGTRDQDEPPFNAGGSAIGKSFTFSSNAKATQFKTKTTGAFTPAQKTATITVASTQETFNVTEINGGKALILAGNSASSNILLFGTSGKTSSAGTGWIFSDTQLIPFKWNLKKQ